MEFQPICGRQTFLFFGLTETSSVACIFILFSLVNDRSVYGLSLDIIDNDEQNYGCRLQSLLGESFGQYAVAY